MNGPSTRSRAVLSAALVATVGGALLATDAAAGAGTAPHAAVQAAAAQNGPPVQPLPRPRDFVKVVDNRYLPWLPGTRWVYAGRGAEKGEKNVVKVLHGTKLIEGIRATVVHDTVSEGGELVEDTFDWYAQDKTGNVWYLGERTRELENGHVVSREGSWRAGVNGGHAGIAMPAHPVLNRRYRQEFDKGNAEDMARVVMGGGQVAVPFGRFTGVRLTDETTPLEPKADEMKFYAKGVGVVMEIELSPHASRSVLVKMRKG